MENSKRDKLINLREKENVMQDKEDIVSVRKKEKQFFQKAPHRSMEQTEEMSMEPEDGSASGFHSPKGTMEPTALSKVLDKAISWLLYFLVFSLPLFILPFSVEIYEFNKVLLLFAVSSLAFLIWIAKMVLVEKRLTFVRTPLDIPIIIFISIVLVSTVFSVDKVSSILGFYGRFSDSLMVYLSLAMVYFVGVNCVATTDSESLKDSESIINNLIKTFFASAFVVVIVSLLYFFGLKFIPWNEAQFRSFNLVGGSLNVLAMYLVPVIIIALGYRGGRNEALPRLYKNALIVMSLIILALIDFILAWIILAISLFVVLVLGVAITKTRQHLVPTGLIILISLVFIASSLTFINKDVQTNFSSSVISDSLRDKLVDGEDNAAKEGFTREIIIEKQTAVSIAIEGAKQDPIAGIIGSGPGTYLYN
ncbi:MAG: hypothetical protein KAS78_04405, partial [Candidatus Pacebacteria bacterium]|nr:hypothetical protein [Candidatus Paceibacterota bacterium]